MNNETKIHGTLFPSVPVFDIIQLNKRRNADNQKGETYYEKTVCSFTGCSDDAWYDVYPGVTGADWWGDPITDPKYVNAIVIGAQEKTDDVYRIEFAINRSVYGITGTIAGFGLCQFDNDWSDLDYMTYEGSTAILLSLDKTE